MDYATVLQRLSCGLPVERIVVEGGQTGGHVVFEEPRRIGKRTSEKYSGQKYAEQYKALEKLEDQKMEAEMVRETNLETVEGLTSIGTLPNLAELEPEYLTQVYSRYSFKNRPDTRLLIHSYQEEILNQIDTNPVTIIKAVTGCGKTTQVPQFILDDHESKNIHCNIVVTQPRRIAAISVAKRVSKERGWPLGSVVGYQIALEKQCSQDTRLLYCTTGVLLMQLVRKQSLADYTHIIVDEVHERDSETDFLLIVIKKFLRNPQCRTKIVLMSATMNVDHFVQYFTRKVRNLEIEPPVIEPSSSLPEYTVSYYYLDSIKERLPIASDSPGPQLTSPFIERHMYDLARSLVEVLHVIDQHEHKDTKFLGSVLIFLPGIHEIEVMFKTLSETEPKNEEEKWWLCPLHSTVTFDEQLKVFKPAPKGYRKIILATNIAESSITVTDIKYVIDFCLAKQQLLEKDTNYSTLQLTWISKSQGSQRAGRVGRVMPGRVYRLVPKHLYQSLPENATPEIMRCPLDQLVLKAKQLQMGPPERLLGLALDPPDLSNIHRTILNLKEMGALLMTVNGVYEDNDGDLTFIGRVMASLPLDTQLSKLIILGHMFSCLSEAIVMASAMSVKSIFSTPFKQQLEAYNSKLTWADSSCSDPIAFYNAYSLWKHKTKMGLFKRSGGQSEEEWCRKYFIQSNLIREVSRLESEILERLKGLGVVETRGDAKVSWNRDVERPLILKLVIGGAFYPNYFIPSNVDEKEAVKTLGGRDPFSTVYLSGLPHNQPGRLYSQHIKKHFINTVSPHVSVTFDNSSKVYLQFDHNLRSASSSLEKNVRMPGKICMAVYRAIKLRHLQIPITIPLLPPHEARKRDREIFGERATPNIFCWDSTSKKDPGLKRNQMPSLATNILGIIITYIESPSEFWVYPNDQANVQRLCWIHSALNREGPLPVYAGPPKAGALVVAPYSEAGKTGGDHRPPEYFRARILSASHDRREVEVFFLDYGNRSTVALGSLRDFGPGLKSVKEEPPVALEATLAELGPSSVNSYNGEWSQAAIKEFKSYFFKSTAVAKVFSAVNNVMSLILFSYQGIREIESENFPFEKSFNHHLISLGYAEPAEEPYLSRENHLLREMAEKMPENVNALGPPETFDLYSDVQFNSPSESECRGKVNLKGPRSPLEMGVYSLARKCQGKEMLVEWNSVNSVLIDTFPMDPHNRLLVAATVTQSSNSDRLTLRNTTLMPNIHGLPALVSMIFAPRVELRADKHRRKLIGALCGLGFDEDTGEARNGENDIEIAFDTQFTLVDLVKVNKLRFWMNYIVCGDEGPEGDITRSRTAQAQQKIKEYVLNLLSERRASLAPLPSERCYEWDQVPEQELLNPLPDLTTQDTRLYPLIWGVALTGEGTRDSAISAHLALLQSLADGVEPMRSGVQCDLCQVFLETPLSLRLHLHTSVHRMKVTEFNRNRTEEPR